MGCGCKERKERWKARLRERGHERTARALDAVPDPGQVADAARRVKRLVLRGPQPDDAGKEPPEAQKTQRRIVVRARQPDEES